jgi:predicted RNase H-like HicB family nuclease
MTKENKILHFPVVIEQDEDEVYIVSCPVFKGCHSYGKTIDEALGNLKEVIEMCVEEEGEKYSVQNRFVGFRELQIEMKESAV